MLENLKGKYKKALLIGTGGGNDIVSTIIPALYLKEHGIHADIAGILSPAAIHEFNSGSKIEQVVNKVDGPVDRIIPSKNPFKISFIDGMLPELLHNHNIDSEVYDFSIRYGTNSLVSEVNKFIKEKGYDLVMGVDVGGDILARGSIDQTLLSPVMDFTTLYLLGNLERPSMLLEFGLGTDGELRPVGMDAVVDELYSKKLLLFKDKISLDDDAVKSFTEIFDKISTVRKGHTAVMTLRTLEVLKTAGDLKNAPDFKDISTEYKFRSQIGSGIDAVKVYTPLDIVLPKKYFGEAYVIDAKKLLARRSHTAFSYDNSLEQYIKLKDMQSMWKTELDTYYLWSGDDDWSWKSFNRGYCVQLLMPSRLISYDNRQALIQKGLSRLDIDSDLALILYSDYANLPSKYFSDNNLRVVYAGNFSIVTKDAKNTIEGSSNERSSNLNSFSDKLSQTVRRYHNKL